MYYKLGLFFIFFLIPNISLGAFDNATITNGSNGVTIKSATHTISSADNIVTLISVYSNNVPSSVTLASTTATSTDIIQDNGDGYYYRLYYVIDPPTGTQTITANFGSNSFVHLAIATYNGIDTSNIFNTTSGINSASATSLTLNFTTTADTHLVGFWSNYAVGGLTAGTNTILRASMSDGTWFYSGGIADSGDDIITSGSHSIQGTFGSGRALALGVALNILPSTSSMISNQILELLFLVLVSLLFLSSLYFGYKLLK